MPDPVPHLLGPGQPARPELERGQEQERGDGGAAGQVPRLYGGQPQDHQPASRRHEHGGESLGKAWFK